MVQVSRAVFFGSPDRPLAGFIHEPSSPCGPAVVLCPPIGREHVVTYAALRALAEQLAAAGILVLRLDYDGTGDSAGGMGDPDRLASWTASIRAAVAFVQEHGAARVTLLGLRLGALLAVSAAEQLPPMADLILWDAQTSGRAFLREQRLLARTVTPQAAKLEDGSVHALGAVLPTEVARELAGLRLTAPAGPLAERVLVVARPGQELAPELLSQLAGSVTQQVSHEQEDLLEVDPPRPAPRVTAAITQWLLDRPRATVSWKPPAERQVAQMADRAGRPLVERPWRSASGRLHGVLSEPLPGGELEDAPGVLLLPPGSWHRIGLGRLWVEVARECAADGIRALRLDLSGLGDSDVRPGQARDVVYADEATDDVLEAAHDFGGPAGVRVVGHCSSAWIALEAGLLAPPVSIHAVATPAYLDLSGWRPAPGPGARTLKRRARLHASVLALGRHPRVERLRFRVPEVVWKIADRTGLLPLPARRLERLLSAGVSVHLISDETDSVWWQAEGRAWMRAHHGSTRFTATQMPLVDHNLHSAPARQQVAQLLRGQFALQPGRKPSLSPT